MRGARAPRAHVGWEGDGDMWQACACFWRQRLLLKAYKAQDAHN